MRWISKLVGWVASLRHRRPVDRPSPSSMVDASGVGEGQRPDGSTPARVSRRTVTQPTLWQVTNTDRRRKLWCGPTVVSALIGIDAAVARDMIKASRGGRAVMGTTARELDIVFRAHGCRLDLASDHSDDPPTLATWCKLPRDPDLAFVVEITGHWVAVRGDWFCDTFTKGQPVRLRHAPHKRKRVRRVYCVSRR